MQMVKLCARMSESLFHRLKDVTIENVVCLLLIESGVTDLLFIENVP